MNAASAPVEVVHHIATPVGRGAVATIIIHGAHALDVVNRLFRPASNQPVTHRHFNRILYGNWTAEGPLGEDLVVCPKSEILVEVHCHGGDAAARAISQSLESHGAAHVTARDIHQRVSGCPYQFDLMLAVSRAPTRRTLRHLLAQPQLHLQLWKKIRGSLENQDRDGAMRLIDDCLQWESFGQHLVQPWTVVLCGEPNVGKSSTINALLGFERSIVHAVAGTTRDVVSNQTAIDGWPVCLFDTAGIRETDNEIERQGIQRARKTMEHSDLIVLLIDAAGTGADRIRRQETWLKPGLIVANKSDLVHFNSAHRKLPEIDLAVSALTGAGIQDLVDSISRRLVTSLPPPDQAVPVSRDQIGLLGAVYNCAGSGHWRRGLKLISAEFSTAAIG